MIRLQPSYAANRSLRPRNTRDGATLVELLIASVVLVSAMSFITTMCFHTNQVWKRIAHQRVAVSELSNQLDHLTLLSVEEAQEAIANLSPSPQCKQTLTSPKLAAQLVEDAIGTRIELQLDWDNQIPSRPVKLSGWIVDFEQSTAADQSPPNSNSSDSAKTNLEKRQ